jgi:glutathione synthase/RimK-type ligase-like ATP-grasp enzyme
MEWIGNDHHAVATASNKVMCFKALSDAGLRTVDWTVDQAAAQAWLDGGRTVYERHVLNGHSGAGIVMKRPKVDAQVSKARLYTKRVAAKFNEYRLHVVADEVIAVQQKRRMSDRKLEELGFRIPDEWARNGIRTYAHGWVFATNDVDPLPPKAAEHAVKAVRAVGGVTGAVDIAVTEDGNDYIIEINTAPALRSFTVCAAYTKALQHLRGIR